MGGGVGAEYLRVSERRMKTTTSTSTSTFTTTNTNSSSNEDGRGQLNGQKTPYFDKPSASSLGLLSNKAEDQHLSPAKDRKRHFGLGAVSSSGQEAMGWGGARRAGLLQPKENVRLGSPERGQTKLNLEARPGIVRGRSTEGDGRVSPKKRARFALEKGIREPGRESLGVQQDSNGGMEDEDDDGLDIV
jgi:minichromosome maintenance protein 10